MHLQALRGCQDVRSDTEVGCAGQFIDHDVVATVDADGDNTFDINLQNGAQTAVMKLHRLVSVPGPDECPVPHTVISPQIDAGVVYGDETAFTQETLRAPGAPPAPVMQP